MNSAVDAEGLSSEWVSKALDRDVRLLSCDRIGTGQLAAAYRLTIDGGGHRQAIVAKVATGDDAARTRMRNSPGPGIGSGASRTSRTSGPPTRVIHICRMSPPIEVP